MKMISVLAATCLLCIPLLSRAETVVIGDFEDGTTQGWMMNSTRAIRVVPDEFTGSGYLLEIDWKGADGFDWSLMLNDSSNPDVLLLNNVGGPQIVEFDIYWDPPADWSGDGSMWWPNVVYNYEGGFTQLDFPTGGDNDSNTLDEQSASHLAWDFIASGKELTGVPTVFAQIWIATDSNHDDALDPITRGKYYIDNITITVVPEPSAATAQGACLVGLALVAAARRASARRGSSPSA